jgi:hypothetical protein
MILNAPSTIITIIMTTTTVTTTNTINRTIRLRGTSRLLLR